jgi:hypothetical protein
MDQVPGQTGKVKAVYTRTLQMLESPTRKSSSAGIPCYRGSSQYEMGAADRAFSEEATTAYEILSSDDLCKFPSSWSDIQLRHMVWQAGPEGKRCVNLRIRKDPEDGKKRTINLGGKATTDMNAGDRIVVMTPGGGGYGPDPNAEQVKQIVGAFRISDKFAGARSLRSHVSVAERNATATAS